MAEFNLLDTSCCEIPRLELCDLVKQFPDHYQKACSFHSIFTESMLNQINCLYDSIRLMCASYDASHFSGDALTDYGSLVGFPRTQCNLACGTSGEVSIDCDEFYRRLIKTHLISKQGNTVDKLCEALDCFFGENAFIISSSGGLTQISAGRDLTEKEKEFLTVIQRVLPHTCGTRIEIFEIIDISQVVGVNCGDCNNFSDMCAGDLCGSCFPVTCVNCEDDLILYCAEDLPYTSSSSSSPNGDIVSIEAFGVTDGYTFTFNPESSTYTVDWDGTGENGSILVVSTDETGQKCAQKVTFSLSPVLDSTLTMSCTEQVTNPDDGIVEVLSCVEMEVIGGLDPQSISYIFNIGSDFVTTGRYEAYYTLNNDPTQNLLVIESNSGPFSNYQYLTLSGIPVVEGDVIKVYVSVRMENVDIGDTGLVTYSGSFTQLDVNDCIAVYEFDEACQWEIVPDLPVCPDATSIDCDDFPITITGFSNANSISSSASLNYTVTPNAANTEVVIDGVGPSEDITITATNDDGSCDILISIDGCVSFVSPSCPQDSTINCSNLPITITGISNATSIGFMSNTAGSGYTVTPNASMTDVTIDGNGGNEIITITAMNANGNCSFNLTVNGCVAPPICPDNTVVQCSSLPLTVTGISGATSVTASSDTPLSSYTVTPNASNTEVLIEAQTAGAGGGEVITITAINANGSCQFEVQVIACGTGGTPPEVGFDCPQMIEGQAGILTTQLFGPFTPFVGGVGNLTLSFSGAGSGFIDYTPIFGGGQYSVEIPPNTAAGIYPYTINVIDDDGNTEVCSGNSIELT